MMHTGGLDMLDRLREVAGVEIQFPAVLPEAIMKDREVAEFCMERNLAEWGSDGPAAFSWRWALTGQGPRPVCGEPWSGGLPSRSEIDAETWMESGWGHLASFAEVRAAKFVLWWLISDPEAEVPQRFVPTTPVRLTA